MAARKSKSKKRRARKFLAATQDQFSISDDLGLSSSDSGEGEITFSVINSSQPAKPTNSAGLSDLDLIMQLARAEEDSSSGAGAGGSGAVDSLLPPPPSSGAGSIGASSSSDAISTANDELQALEDLEKELGLDDLNLFGSSKSTGASGDDGKGASTGGSSFGGAAGGSSGGGSSAAKLTTEDDDLDDLEKYLQSLSSTYREGVGGGCIMISARVCDQQRTQRGMAGERISIG